MLQYLIDSYGKDYFFPKPAKTPAKIVISLELKIYPVLKLRDLHFQNILKGINHVFRDLNRDVSEAMNMEGLQDLEERFSNQAIQ